MENGIVSGMKDVVDFSNGDETAARIVYPNPNGIDYEDSPATKWLSAGAVSVVMIILALMVNSL